jgi:filamentous hemagglutinin family protein
MALALALTLPAYAAGPLPSGGHFVAGQGSICGTGTSLTINQRSGRGVIDWNGFSIGSGNSVRFNNGQGATLNRVTGLNPTSILGALTATGSVYLINPQGIVVGPTGTISTGGRFVASTLETSNAAFMAAGPLTFSGNSDAAVINLGKIGSSNGDVFLIAKNAVGNFGTISAAKGTAELAVGQRILLQDSSDSRQIFVQTGSGGMVINSGAIRAAQISLQAADGNIFALAGNHEALRATGTATRDGHVWLVADKGTVVLAGRVAASNANGSGGTVDTNVGRRLLPGVGLVVSAGSWNIAAPAFTIDSAAAHAFAHSLDSGTSINLQTTGANASGNINVAANIGWIGGASLTLGAYHTIRIGSGVSIANSGKGNLILHADATAIDNGGSVLNGGKIDWSRSTGLVSAFYDMNGHYVAGTLLRNTAWVPAAYSGLVTQLTAYKLVNSLADLQKMASNLSGNYALGTNIDAIDTTGTAVYTPVGTSANPFTGQFDGMGHTIASLSYQNLTHVSGPIGLFGTIGKTGVVRNVGLTDSNTDPSPPPYGNFSCPAGGCVVGIIAGDNKGVIANVYTSGGMTDDTPYINAMFGGIAGKNEGLIERSWSNASSGDSIVNGGLAAVNTGTITQSYSSGGMWANGTNTIAGGLVGINRGTITQSYTSGGYVVGGEGDTAAKNVIGGLVGVNSGTISQSYAADLIVPHNATAGAVVGKNTGHISPDVYWSVDSTELSNGGPGVPAANGLSAEQMADPASFHGWNFGRGGAWVMPQFALSPSLAWQPSE